MEPFEDYYEILQVHPSAEPEVIEAAYRKLAQKYHPDVSKNPADQGKMKKINIAHDVLANPEQRKQYHAEWLQKKGGAAGSARNRAFGKPKPILEPAYIKFKNVRVGDVKKASFLILNAGGPYSGIHIDNTERWLTIIDYHSLMSSDELPLKVNIQAQGMDWNMTYSGRIRVKLDEAEATLPVELQTRIRLMIKDHKWHDIDYDNLRDWVKRRKDTLAAGEELKGKTFRYKLNHNTGRYQIRLSHKYTTAVYDPKS